MDERPSAPASGGRPWVIDAAALAMLVDELLGVAVYARSGVAGLGVGCSVVLVVGLAYSLWIGRGWARWLTVAFSALQILVSLFLVFGLPANVRQLLPAPVQLELLLRASLSALLIWGLNTRASREFFVAARVRA